MSRTLVDWDSGTWSHPPVTSEVVNGALVVTAAEGSDAWRHTSYGFVRDNPHALLKPFVPDSAIEVTFIASLPQQFDQAGIYISADSTHWVKAGVEHADGVVQLGAVVTDGESDWSAAPVDEWADRKVTIRASWVGNAITVRARVDDEPWRMSRLLPMTPDAQLEAGPYVCAPTRSGLAVTFLSWKITDADASLH